MSDTPETDAAKFTTYSTRHEKYIEAVTVDFARAQERRIAALERGEFICKSCGLRKNGETDVQPEF